MSPQHAACPARDLWLGQPVSNPLCPLPASDRARRGLHLPACSLPGVQGGSVPGQSPPPRCPRGLCTVRPQGARAAISCPAPTQANLAPGRRTPRGRAALCLVHRGSVRPCPSSASPRRQSGRSAQQLGSPALLNLQGASPRAAKEAPGTMAGSQEGPPHGPQPVIHTARRPLGRHQVCLGCQRTTGR